MTEYHDPSNVTNPEHADHHIVTPVTYAMVFATLLICTSNHSGMRRMSTSESSIPVVALAIACTKAVIVILFFMHVKYQSKLVKLTVSPASSLSRTDHDDADATTSAARGDSGSGTGVSSRVRPAGRIFCCMKFPLLCLVHSE